MRVLTSLLIQVSQKITSTTFQMTEYTDLSVTTSELGMVVARLSDNVNAAPILFPSFLLAKLVAFSAFLYKLNYVLAFAAFPLYSLFLSLNEARKKKSMRLLFWFGASHVFWLVSLRVVVLIKDSPTGTCMFQYFSAI